MKSNLVRVSDITGYIYCPRVCYFRLKHGGQDVNELHAAKEIYSSRRSGFDDNWAKEKFVGLYGEENLDVFDKALKNFVFNPMLDEFEQMENDIVLESPRLRLKGKLDEMVRFRGKNYPLVLALRSPEDGVWYRDRIKIAAFCMLLGDAGIEVSMGFVYHCFDGEIKRVEVRRKDRYAVMKLVERVAKLVKGFMPEGVNDSKCTRCPYSEECQSEPVTFASRFL
ncbi:Dna2/Cas4 domain-containing protein [Archaeoglobus veneficus]|uniref:CRISPR-associated protein Cas4 n=1 Tax=Archaeoglobus veneficus (strain DSM 11195 / SNP6) TaxID=693661 RepID=F2KPA5_ARCVS|nr:Dna2/Cas4 domain-containing protein [Archaeoglobus veneficus]AEA47509.1 CRISPR-associated protein Cas4 [Archaeoglobus veneficus SNP6]